MVSRINRRVQSTTLRYDGSRWWTNLAYMSAGALVAIIGEVTIYA